jgi:hypothetical protein
MGFGNYTLRSKIGWAIEKTGWAKPTQAPPPHICAYGYKHDFCVQSPKTFCDSRIRTFQTAQQIFMTFFGYVFTFCAKQGFIIGRVECGFKLCMSFIFTINLSFELFGYLVRKTGLIEVGQRDEHQD